MFSVRLITTDYYLAPPIKGLDVCYSDFRGNQITKVPVIRIFGTTSVGQKTCLHVHGVFPYILVPYDGKDCDVDKFSRQLALSIDKAVNISQGSSGSSNQHVFKISLVSGVPFYGYHQSERSFLRIYLYNPILIKKTVELLQNGAIMNQAFQPHEAHAPYLLQMFIDYNLFGMSMVHLSNVKFRVDKEIHESLLNSAEKCDSESTVIFSDDMELSYKSAKYWDVKNIPLKFILEEHLEKESTCELELDCLASNIVNRIEVDNAISEYMNPGLQTIWEDERKRRKAYLNSSALTPNVSQDRGSQIESEIESCFLERLRNILKNSQCDIKSSPASDRSLESSKRATPSCRLVNHQSSSNCYREIGDGSEEALVDENKVLDSQNCSSVTSSSQDLTELLAGMISTPSHQSECDEDSESETEQESIEMSQIIWSEDKFDSDEIPCNQQQKNSQVVMSPQEPKLTLCQLDGANDKFKNGMNCNNYKPGYYYENNQSTNYSDLPAANNYNAFPQNFNCDEYSNPWWSSQQCFNEQPMPTNHYSVPESVNSVHNSDSWKFMNDNYNNNTHVTNLDSTSHENRNMDSSSSFLSYQNRTYSPYFSSVSNSTGYNGFSCPTINSQNNLYQANNCSTFKQMPLACSSSSNMSSVSSYNPSKYLQSQNENKSQSTLNSNYLPYSNVVSSQKTSTFTNISSLKNSKSSTFTYDNISNLNMPIIGSTSDYYAKKSNILKFDKYKADKHKLPSSSQVYSDNKYLHKNSKSSTAIVNKPITAAKPISTQQNTSESTNSYFDKMNMKKKSDVNEFETISATSIKKILQLSLQNSSNPVCELKKSKTPCKPSLKSNLDSSNKKQSTGSVKKQIKKSRSTSKRKKYFSNLEYESDDEYLPSLSDIIKPEKSTRKQRNTKKCNKTPCFDNEVSEKNIVTSDKSVKLIEKENSSAKISVAHCKSPEINIFSRLLSPAELHKEYDGISKTRTVKVCGIKLKVSNFVSDDYLSKIGNERVILKRLTGNQLKKINQNNSTTGYKKPRRSVQLSFKALESCQNEFSDEFEFENQILSKEQLPDVLKPTSSLKKYWKVSSKKGSLNLKVINHYPSVSKKSFKLQMSEKSNADASQRKKLAKSSKASKKSKNTLFFDSDESALLSIEPDYSNSINKVNPSSKVINHVINDFQDLSINTSGFKGVTEELKVNDELDETIIKPSIEYNDFITENKIDSSKNTKSKTNKLYKTKSNLIYHNTKDEETSNQNFQVLNSVSGSKVKRKRKKKHTILHSSSSYNCKSYRIENLPKAIVLMKRLDLSKIKNSRCKLSDIDSYLNDNGTSETVGGSSSDPINLSQDLLPAQDNSKSDEVIEEEIVENDTNWLSISGNSSETDYELDGSNDKLQDTYYCDTQVELISDKDSTDKTFKEEPPVEKRYVSSCVLTEEDFDKLRDSLNLQKEQLSSNSKQNTQSLGTNIDCSNEIKEKWDVSSLSGSPDIFYSPSSVHGQSTPNYSDDESDAVEPLSPKDTSVYALPMFKDLHCSNLEREILGVIRKLVEKISNDIDSNESIEILDSSTDNYTSGDKQRKNGEDLNLARSPSLDFESGDCNDLGLSFESSLDCNVAEDVFITTENLNISGSSHIVDNSCVIEDDSNENLKSPNSADVNDNNFHSSSNLVQLDNDVTNSLSNGVECSTITSVDSGSVSNGNKEKHDGDDQDFDDCESNVDKSSFNQVDCDDCSTVGNNLKSENRGNIFKCAYSSSSSDESCTLKVTKDDSDYFSKKCVYEIRDSVSKSLDSKLSNKNPMVTTDNRLAKEDVNTPCALISLDDKLTNTELNSIETCALKTSKDDSDYFSKMCVYEIRDSVSEDLDSELRNENRINSIDNEHAEDVNSSSSMTQLDNKSFVSKVIKDDSDYFSKKCVFEIRDSVSKSLDSELHNESPMNSIDNKHTGRDINSSDSLTNLDNKSCALKVTKDDFDYFSKKCVYKIRDSVSENLDSKLRKENQINSIDNERAEEDVSSSSSMICLDNKSCVSKFVKDDSDYFSKKCVFEIRDSVSEILDSELRNENPMYSIDGKHTEEDVNSSSSLTCLDNKSWELKVTKNDSDYISKMRVYEIRDTVSKSLDSELCNEKPMNSIDNKCEEEIVNDSHSLISLDDKLINSESNSNKSCAFKVSKDDSDSFSKKCVYEIRDSVSKSLVSELCNENPMNLMDSQHSKEDENCSLTLLALDKKLCGSKSNSNESDVLGVTKDGSDYLSKNCFYENRDSVSKTGNSELCHTKIINSADNKLTKENTNSFASSSSETKELLNQVINKVCNHNNEFFTENIPAQNFDTCSPKDEPFVIIDHSMIRQENNSKDLEKIESKPSNSNKRKSMHLMESEDFEFVEDLEKEFSTEMSVGDRSKKWNDNVEVNNFESNPAETECDNNEKATLQNTRLLENDLKNCVEGRLFPDSFHKKLQQTRFIDDSSEMSDGSVSPEYKPGDINMAEECNFPIISSSLSDEFQVSPVCNQEITSKNDSNQELLKSDTIIDLASQTVQNEEEFSDYDKHSKNEGIGETEKKIHHCVKLHQLPDDSKCGDAMETCDEHNTTVCENKADDTEDEQMKFLNDYLNNRSFLASPEENAVENVTTTAIPSLKTHKNNEGSPDSLRLTPSIEDQGFEDSRILSFYGDQSIFIEDEKDSGKNSESSQIDSKFEESSAALHSENLDPKSVERGEYRGNSYHTKNVFMLCVNPPDKMNVKKWIENDLNIHKEMKNVEREIPNKDIICSPKNIHNSAQLSNASTKAITICYSEGKANSPQYSNVKVKLRYSQEVKSSKWDIDNSPKSSFNNRSSKDLIRPKRTLSFYESLDPDSKRQKVSESFQSNDVSNPDERMESSILAKPSKLHHLVRHPNLHAGRSLFNESSLEGPTPNNTFNFNFSVDDVPRHKSEHQNQYLTSMSLEIHANTRGNLKPDPKFDAVVAIFYFIHNDENNSDKNSSGVILLGCSDDHGTSSNSLNLNEFHKFKSLYASQFGMNKLEVTFVTSEKNLYQELIDLVRRFDPEILVGYEIQMLSWGYLIDRAKHLKINLCPQLSRVPSSLNSSHSDENIDSYGADHMSEIHVAGRIVLNGWRIFRSHVTLNIYSFENVYYHVMHQRIPAYSSKSLTLMFNSPSQQWKAIDYYALRSIGTMQMLDRIDCFRQTSEFSRVFGITFYEVLTRGSQIRVESLMLRCLRMRNFIAVSPSVHQRAQSAAPECIPLVMEPESMFYEDPVLVLDFQSLYPSICIAYNYCYSTCLGKVDCLGKSESFKFGCTNLTMPSALLQELKDEITVSPAGHVFVTSDVRQGILPQMLKEILNTRIMVKKSMKNWENDKALQKLLNARQMGLKLIANVTYGYTSANYSGRMPCVEVADSIVSKARQTLEKAIQLVENTKRWNAKVVYGDTDSMFVLLPGRSKSEAFKIGKEIAELVTHKNPKPVKLKFEKVYKPCILQTKKRYVGFMYESENQKDPIYDAKGIETVRRDTCPVVSKMLEKSLKILFESSDMNLVKNYVTRQFQKICVNKVSLQDYIFSKEYRGRHNYRPGACVPALKLARKFIQKDPRSEPRIGERVPYVIIYGSPGLPLIQLVKTPEEYLQDQSLRINANYYITRMIGPALNRALTLAGANVLHWYADMPRVSSLNSFKMISNKSPVKSTISQYFVKLNCLICDDLTYEGICKVCKKDPQVVSLQLSQKVRNYERSYDDILKICKSCSGCSSNEIDCISLDCPNMFKLHKKKLEYTQIDSLRELMQNIINI